ncbi:MAG: aldehyde dehydrogenase family protein [Solirubrobacteraceae bacterium]|nr:aldehyde dehydrogenase family protein [Solirubrobacteraceae bacterium]
MTVTSVSPIDGATLGSVPATAPDRVAAEVEAAALVQPLWAQLRLTDRARYLRRAAQAVIDEWDELSELLVREGARPRAEVATMELLPAVDTLQWLADAGPKVLGTRRVPVSRTLFPVKRARLTHAPLGVVGVLTPASEPFATPLGDVAVALMAGNAVLLAPSALAPLAAERVLRVFARAGIPEGLVRVLHGGPEVGRALVRAPIAQVRFTGSDEAGRDVEAARARELHRAAIDVGGRDAMLVLADADPERSSVGATWAAFAHAGQCGGSVKRAYVVASRAERFVADVSALARAMRVGDPREAEIEIGPPLAADRVETVRKLVDAAVAGGATLHCGGVVDDVPGLAGPALAPMVLTAVPADADLRSAAVPGPVLVVDTVADEDEAIVRANAARGGLGASVWTANRHRGTRIARELRAGMVWGNDHQVTRAAPQLPWGAIGGAGLGRARGADALRASAEPKLITWDPPGGRAAWWAPYDGTAVAAWHALAQLRSVRDQDREDALRTGVLPLARIAARTARAARRD